MITACRKLASLRLVAIGGAVGAVALAALFVTLPRQAAAERPFNVSANMVAVRSAIDNDGQDLLQDRPAVAAQQAITIGPTCEPDDQFLDLYGNPVVLSAPGSVATPIGTTYSVHHLIGADTDGDGLTNCVFVAADPPPGAPDDIVTYDGLPEAIRTDVLGTVPTVVEGTTDNADGTHTLEVYSSSPAATELFPGGFVDLPSGKPLTDACFLLGFGLPQDDPLDWEGMDTVMSASITFLKDGGVVVGPLDVTSRFTNPWNGLFATVLLNGAGADINGVKLEILVEKTPPDPLGACCVGGQCVGDIMEISCDFQGGTWHFGASCGQNPNLPAPICDQAACSFDNGLPLDDLGVPTSQYAPDEPFADAAADDFILRGSGTDPCRINQVRVWTTHPDAVRAVNPGTDYAGVNVTVYANAVLNRPAGRPEEDGTHSANFFGGIAYSQKIPMSALTVTPLTPGSCAGDDLWRLDIPVDIVLNKDVKYWLEVQPIMNFAELGRVALLLSDSANDHPAQRISARLGVTQWQSISGNAGACPAGNPPTPPAGTHRDIAFLLSGEEYTGTPPNDDCADAVEVADGVRSFSNLRASTDGPNEPEVCNFYLYSHVESDIWFDYRAVCTGNLKVSLCGSTYDTKLAVYAGCGYCPPRGLPVACNEDAPVCNLQSEVILPVDEGECFTIRVGGHRGKQGYGIMTIRCQEPPPPTGACCDQDGVCLGTISEAQCAAEEGTWFEGQNCATFSCPVYPPPHDLCSQCIPVFTDVRYDGKTNSATGTDITSCGTNDTADVWHCWTADCNGPTTFDLCNSSYDTTLAVFEACGGRELACNDDDCGTRSRKTLAVTAGRTYYIRVSGHQGAVGNYALIVQDCAVACCRPDGRFCALRSPTACLAVGGIPHGPGSICLGDHNSNGIDDACETCPPSEIVDADPPDGTVDARQPHAHNATLPRQGIGSPGPGSVREPIVITLNPPNAGGEDCFRLCETIPDPLLGANSVSDVTYLGSGAYEIVLDHAITAGGVTTIKYQGGGSFVEYTSHPANVDGDSASGPVDILVIIDILNLASPAPWGEYSCDVDHSGLCGPADILRVIDLLNGADLFDPWLGRPRPANTSCP